MPSRVAPGTAAPSFDATGGERLRVADGQPAGDRVGHGDAPDQIGLSQRTLRIDFELGMLLDRGFHGRLDCRGQLLDGNGRRFRHSNLLRARTRWVIWGRVIIHGHHRPVDKRPSRGGGVQDGRAECGCNETTL